MSANVITFYDNGIETTQAILPVSEQFGDRYPAVPAPTAIDQRVVAKLKKLGVTPSALCTDEEFLRRVSLDLVGMKLHQFQQVRGNAFVVGFGGCNEFRILDETCAYEDRAQNAPMPAV